MKIKIICLLFFTFFIKNAFAQNLLLNGDFEEVVPNKGNYQTYLDTFYAKHWYQPTDCSVDIYRDHKVCNSSNVMSITSALQFCLRCASGNYCIGLYGIDYFGYMEHLTGKLSKPLEAGKKYKISFAMKFFIQNNVVIASKGFGYKFNKDSILFHTDNPLSLSKSLSPRSKKLTVRSLHGGKNSPFYYDLFATEKVYADFSFQEYMTDSTWHNYTTYYTAKGGERFITFGQFAYKDDKKIIEQMLKLRQSPYVEKITKFITSNKSLFVHKFSDNFADGMHNYYLMDNIKVEELLEEEATPEKTCNGCFNVTPISNQ